MALLSGLGSAGHCVGMCAPLTSVLIPAPQRMAATAFVHVGRILGYGLWGAVFGLSAQGLLGFTPLLWLSSVIRGLVTVMLGLLALRLWRDRDDVVSRWLGVRVWRHAKGLLAPVQGLPTPWRWLASGLLWALLPCGMVYSMLLLALATASVWKGASLLLWFGLGTLPTLMLISLGGSLVSHPTLRLMSRTGLRRLVATAVAGLCLWNFGLLSGFIAPSM